MKTNGNESGKETLTANISFCDDDWAYLRQTLVKAGLESYLCSTNEALLERLEQDQVDPMLTASTAIIRIAILSLGVDEIIKHKGCPLCAFRDIVPLISESVARSYLRSH